MALIGPDTWGKGSWLTRREGADVPEWSIAVVIDAEGRLVREIGEQIVAVAYQLDNLVTQVRTMKTDGRGWVTGKQTNSSLEVTVSLTENWVLGSSLPPLAFDRRLSRTTCTAEANSYVASS
ncbi:MAG TPA: hypothetical protein VG032_02265 [Acidimicrobiales bacterium]|nr:hypothetical protein [Acidimicrobiales bacterium]